MVGRAKIVATTIRIKNLHFGSGNRGIFSTDTASCPKGHDSITPYVQWEKAERTSSSCSLKIRITAFPQFFVCSWLQAKKEKNHGQPVLALAQNCTCCDRVAERRQQGLCEVRSGWPGSHYVELNENEILGAIETNTDQQLRERRSEKQRQFVAVSFSAVRRSRLGLEPKGGSVSPTVPWLTTVGSDGRRKISERSYERRVRPVRPVIQVMAAAGRRVSEQKRELDAFPTQ